VQPNFEVPNAYLTLTFENSKDNLLKVYSVTKEPDGYILAEKHSQSIMPADAIKDPSFKCDFRQTRVEGDGNIY